MCDFKKPIIMSTGAASLAEIAEAVSWIEAKGNPLALLHCVLNYPTMDENAALGMIPALVRHFPQHVIGYSDHTLPNDMKVLEVRHPARRANPLKSTSATTRRCPATTITTLWITRISSSSAGISSGRCP